MKTKAIKKNNSDNVWIYNNKRFIVITVAVMIFIILLLQINFNALLPIKKIRAQGEFINVTEKMILDAISVDVHGGYLKVNVHHLQTKIEKLPWVKVAAVRRVWPDSIVVTIKEQKAYAVWKSNSLLNELGEKFEPKSIILNNLPILNGPDNLNVKVMSEYKIIEAQLNTIGLSVDVFHLNARRAINLKLANSIQISLGRSEYQLRLKRFITAFKLSLRKYSENIEYVDMRYTNGFSIKWKENTQAATAENVLRGVLDV
ncbi:Cell division protein FtsQ [hydrothermal vent metagenome]|uniref:Cell division protein FtsQ n=1 Tax=hydrothermal vent metagenome TaxID=652676 RepID=A0A3B1A501_9ZZZZ